MRFTDSLIQVGLCFALYNYVNSSVLHSKLRDAVGLLLFMMTLFIERIPSWKALIRAILIVWLV